MWSDIKKAIIERRNVTDQTEWIRSLLKQEASALNSKQTLLSGVASNSSSSAFWVGYQVAIQRVFGSVLQSEIAAFVVNENRSFKPADWKTSIHSKDPGYLLSGYKDFVTAPDQVDVLLVAANELVQSRSISRICKVMKCNNGVSLSDISLPVFSELNKARGRFDEVLLDKDAVIQKDGFDAFIKPFRVVEDYYVSLSILGYLLRRVLLDELEFSEYVGRLTVLFSTLEESESALDCYFNQGQSPVMLCEAVIKEIAELTIALIKKHDLLADLKQDLMVMKIGEKAREIRFQRALNAVLEIGVS
jgi:hypothetical protein